MSYQARRAPQTETLALRGLKFQLYRWSGTDPRPLVLVHGWGDTSETWQFVVDQLSPARTVVAVDMRGFGRTQRPDRRYWFPDYLADLDALLDHLSPDAPLDLVGHSMGGNIVMLYAGVAPPRRAAGGGGAVGSGGPQHGRQHRDAVRRRAPAARAQGGEPGSVRVAAYECGAGAGAL